MLTSSAVSSDISGIPRRVIVPEEYDHVEAIVPVESEVIASQDDYEKLHSVVVLQVVLKVHEPVA